VRDLPLGPPLRYECLWSLKRPGRRACRRKNADGAVSTTCTPSATPRCVFQHIFCARADPRAAVWCQFDHMPHARQARPQPRAVEPALALAVRLGDPQRGLVLALGDAEQLALVALARVATRAQLLLPRAAAPPDLAHLYSTQTRREFLRSRARGRGRTEAARGEGKVHPPRRRARGRARGAQHQARGRQGRAPRTAARRRNCSSRSSARR
jgi:hypothetical protein